MSTEKERIANFFTTEADKIEQDRKTALEERGFEETFRLPIGQTTLVVLKKIPELKDGTFGQLYLFEILIEGVHRLMMVGIHSPLRREIVHALTALPVSADRVEMTIVRTGEGRQTRYSVVKG